MEPEFWAQRAAEHLDDPSPFEEMALYFNKEFQDRVRATYVRRNGGCNWELERDATLAELKFHACNTKLAERRGETPDPLSYILRKLRELEKVTELYIDPTFDRTCSIVIPDFKAANDQFIEYVSRHPANLHELHWRKFEELLEAIFRNLGYRTYLGPGRGDDGVDLRIIQKDSVGELVTLVQAKCNSPQNPIKLEAVAALYAVVEDQQANRGLFITTSRYLPVAMRFAAKRSQRLVLATSSEVASWCQDIVSTRARRRDHNA